MDTGTAIKAMVNMVALAVFIGVDIWLAFSKGGRAMPPEHKMLWYQGLNLVLLIAVITA